MTTNDDESVASSVLPEREVSFSDQTKLCKLIMAGKYKQASKRIWSHREEASTWICIQKPPEPDDKDNDQKNYTFRKLPIHIACRMLSNHSKPTKADSHLENLIIQFIVLHPLACTKADHEGQLPIHEAINRHASVRVIAMLLTAYPGSILHRDIHGRTPVHVNRSRPDGRINYVENALAKGVRFWEKAREQVKNPYAEDEMSMIKKAAAKFECKRDDDVVLHHQDDMTGFTPRRGKELVKQDGFTRALKRISVAARASVLNASVVKVDGDEDEEVKIEPEESADLAVSAIEEAVSEFFEKMDAMKEEEEIVDSDDGDSTDPVVANLESKIRRLERMLNESYCENNELVEALKGVNESYGKDKRGKDGGESVKGEVIKLEDSMKDDAYFVSDENIVHPSISSENAYLKRKIKVKEEEIQYLQKELSRLRRINTANRQEVERLLSESRDGPSGTISMIEEAKKQAKRTSGLHPNMTTIIDGDADGHDDEGLAAPIKRSDGKQFSSDSVKKSTMVSTKALHLKLRMRFKDSIELSDTFDAQADFDAILKALESSSKFATERFLARKVQELESKLNDAHEARKADAEIYMKEMDGLLLENDALKEKLGLEKE